MTEATILLGIRLLGAISLLFFLASVAYFLRQEIQISLQQAIHRRESYGRLIVVATQGDDPPMGAVLPLMPATTLGRSWASTIHVNNSYASHDHARVIQRMGQWWLEDRQSRNGTLLNGDLVKEPVVLSSGDIISIGALELRLELDS